MFAKVLVIFCSFIATGCAVPQDYKICSEQDLFGIQSLDIDIGSSTVTVTVDIIPLVTIDAGTIDGKVTRSLFKKDVVVLQRTYDICDTAECPLLHNRNITVGYDLDAAEVPSGKYDVQMKAYDEDDQILTCVKFDINV